MNVGGQEPGSPLTSDLREAVVNVTRTERLLVALDFDGTLAPEVDDPADARALPDALTAICELGALPRTPVALVSGRALESLQAAARVPESVLMIGSHGVEVRLDREGVRNTLTEEERATVSRLGNLLEEQVRPFSGAWVEPKPAGFAVHTRLASEADAQEAQSSALARVRESFDGVTVRSGKNLIEFAVRATTKGDAIRTLRAHTRATAVVYVGDDVTDEDAFAALESQDVGVKCGPGETRAAYRVARPHDVGGLVSFIARMRASGLSGSP